MSKAKTIILAVGKLPPTLPLIGGLPLTDSIMIYLVKLGVSDVRNS